MTLDLADYEDRAREAVKLFWGNRAAAIEKQIALGKVDAGTRGAVTAGKNMDGFLALVLALIERNGLAMADIHVQRRMLTLPGYFRPTKLWDMLVMYRGQLVAALEFKSQVGPSFGNNFNNRAEEAIGTAHDLWTAYREGALGKDSPRPSWDGLCCWRTARSHALLSGKPPRTSRSFRSSDRPPMPRAMTSCAASSYRKGSTHPPPSLLHPGQRTPTGRMDT